MKGVTMLKHTGPMTEISYFCGREPVGMKRRARRIFWHAHRRELALVIAEQLMDASDLALENVFSIGAEQDRENAMIQAEIDHLERRLNSLRRHREDLRDQMYELEDESERIHDRIWELEKDEYWQQNSFVSYHHR